MQASRKELLFITTILVFSSLCSFYSGVGLQLYEKVNPMNLKNIGFSEPIRSNETINAKLKDYIFKGGYCYKVENPMNQADFRQGTISNIPTSDYWKFPNSKIESSLKLSATRNGFIAILSVPYELNLPIISLICDPEAFFSYENGIYIKGIDADFKTSETFYPSPWNKPANFYRKENDKTKVHFTYYDEQGNSQISGYAMAEISGKATRSLPQKSLKLSTFKKDGQKNFKFDFFKDSIEYNSLVLRNGGNDNTKSLFRDMLMQTLMGGTGVLVSGFVPCEVFLNGEYWGIHFLQNKSDENFIAKKYNVKEKKVTLVESWKLEKGSETEHLELMEFINSEKKPDGMDEISDLIDLDNMTDFLAGEMFFANTDWPRNNLKMYKISDSSNDTKWKFVFFDLDYGFGYTGDDAYNIDMFHHLLSRNDKFSRLFGHLMKSAEFKLLLKNKMEKLLNDFCTEKRMISKINEISNRLQKSIYNHTARWRKPNDISDWEEEVDLIKDFAMKRGRVFRQQMEKYLN